MPYSYIWIVAKDRGGAAIPGASVMEGEEILGWTGGPMPLPLDPRVYWIHLESAGLESDQRVLDLVANTPAEAPTVEFVLAPPTTSAVGPG
jgi:hypothetical protein